MDKLRNPTPGFNPAVPKQNPQCNTIDTPPSTPTALTSTAHQLLEDIQGIYSALIRLPNLAPGFEINTLLTHLVDLCIQPYGEAFSTYFLSLQGVTSLCESLRPLCGAAEGELERYWAQRFCVQKILDSSSTDSSPTTPSTTQALLTAFPYYTNYLDLSRLECSILDSFLPVPSSSSQPINIAFIGSGPLPLTSFCILDRYPNAHIHNIDRDVSALKLSSALAQKCGYSSRMTFSCEVVGSTDAVATPESPADSQSDDGEITTSTNWKVFNIVFLAALVGMDSATKIQILASLKEKLEKGTLVVARSAWGVRGVLYPVLELSSELQEVGYEILGVVHPWTKVVNSVVVLRVK